MPSSDVTRKAAEGMAETRDHPNQHRPAGQGPIARKAMGTRESQALIIAGVAGISTAPPRLPVVGGRCPMGRPGRPSLHRIEALRCRKAAGVESCLRPGCGLTN